MVLRVDFVTHWKKLIIPLLPIRYIYSLLTLDVNVYTYCPDLPFVQKTPQLHLWWDCQNSPYWSSPLGDVNHEHAIVTPPTQCCTLPATHHAQVAWESTHCEVTFQPSNLICQSTLLADNRGIYTLINITYIKWVTAWNILFIIPSLWVHIPVGM